MKKSDTQKRSPAQASSSARWVGMHNDHIAGADQSLSRLMRRLKRDGVPVDECAFRLMPPAELQRQQ